jgi:hypothetical protein
VELWREATRLLEPLAATTPPKAQTPWEPDSARGTIRRQLWRTTEIAGWNGWGHLAQVWLVRTQRRNPDGTTAVIEERYFLTSLSRRQLNADEALAAVRAHWGVENNAHGSADVFFQEDDSPCSKTGEGIVCATLLRLLAINLCQLYRHRQRRGGGRKPMTWQMLFDDVLFALRLPAAVFAARPPA